MHNVNIKTGIRFGVINANRTDIWEHPHLEYLHSDDWEDCIGAEIDTRDLKLHYDNNSNIIMVFFSRNIKKCKLCSPCYPNAGDLQTLDPDGFETYAIPEDYMPTFEQDKT